MKKLVIVIAAFALLAPVTASASRIGQSNAARAAQNYVQTMPFSYKSLVEQLQFDGYSRGDALYGASHSGANWMQQAVLSARNYLQTMPFSYSDLIGQLKFDGFTPAQARHGAAVAYH
jgi:hypothetical protein